MKKALISGGKGDLASEIIKMIKPEYSVYSPSSKELNVTDLNQVKSYIQMNGPFELLINNAGTIHPQRILESDENKWVQDIMVNLIGPYYMSKKCLELNEKTIIINIASTAAFAAYKDWSSYCASKAGLVTFTKAIANDSYNAYAIAPGAILTKFRNHFNLPNNNALPSNSIANIVIEILQDKYTPGDIIFIRKDEKKIL